MTTEIAVINRLGVALAADSAVTISGFGSEKVFDTGDKLFELYPDQPLAIMVNGNLDFLGVPWELIIKDFREVIVPSGSLSVQQWSERFLESVNKHRAVNKEEVSSYVERFAEDRIAAIQKSAMKKISEALEKGRRSVNKAAVGQILRDEIDSFREQLDSLAVIKSLEGLSPERIARLYGSVINGAIKEKFGKGGITRENAKAVKDVIAIALLRLVDEGSSTGLVVCGFGGGDLFPSLYGISIDGVVGGRLRYEITHDVEITRSSSPGDRTKELGTAISFAQTDVIDRLLRGGDERLINGSRQFVERFVSEALPNVLDSAGWHLTDTAGKDVPVNRLSTFLRNVTPSLYERAARRIGDEIEREF